MKPITTISTVNSTSHSKEGDVPRRFISDVPDCYIRARSFLLSGNENREWEAYQAYSGRSPWTYSIPLSMVVSYLKWRGPSR